MTGQARDEEEEVEMEHRQIGPAGSETEFGGFCVEDANADETSF